MGKILDLITRELMVLFIAAMPLAELKGAIPIGVYMGMHPLHATVLGIIGSLIPAPFLFMFLRPIFYHLRQTKIFREIVDRIVKRTLHKSRNIKKYSVIGLMVFVALPLPTTGVWSGCLAALLLNIPFKQAFPAITLGASISGMIVFILSYAMVNL